MSLLRKEPVNSMLDPICGLYHSALLCLYSCWEFWRDRGALGRATFTSCRGEMAFFDLDDRHKRRREQQHAGFCRDCQESQSDKTIAMRAAGLTTEAHWQRDLHRGSIA